VRSITINGLGKLAMRSNQTFQPPPAVKKIVIGGCKRCFEGIGRQKIRIIFRMRTEVIAKVNLKTSLHQPGEAGRSIGEGFSAIDP
jgi:hypothetical protein